MKTILVPFDFSNASENALNYAANFLRKDPATKIFLLHITDDRTEKNRIQLKLEEVISRYENHLSSRIKPRVEAGDMIPTILQIQEELDVDLIIMGTKGAEGNDEHIATRTLRFVQDADLPVLVIPEKVKKFKLETIILPVGNERILDTSPLFVLLDVARTFKAHVHVLTVHRAKVEMGYSERMKAMKMYFNTFLKCFTRTTRLQKTRI